MDYRPIFRAAQTFLNSIAKLADNPNVIYLNDPDGNGDFYSPESAAQWVAHLRPKLDFRENIIVDLDDPDTISSTFIRELCSGLSPYGDQVSFQSNLHPERVRIADRYWAAMQLPSSAAIKHHLSNNTCTKCGHPKKSHNENCKTNSGTRCCTELVQVGGFRTAPQECLCEGFETRPISRREMFQQLTGNDE